MVTKGCGAFLLCSIVTAIVTYSNFASAEPTMGQRVFDGLPKDRQEDCHSPIKPRDYPLKSGEQINTSQPSTMTAVAIAQDTPIEIEMNGFGIRVPRSAKEVTVTAPNKAGPWRICAMSSTGDVEWLVTQDPPPKPQLVRGTEPAGAFFPLYIVLSVMGRSPIPGFPELVHTDNSLRIPMTAERVTIELKNRVPTHPYKIDVQLPDWRLFVDLSPPSPFGKGYFDQCKVSLVVWSDRELHYLIDPLVEAGEAESDVRAAFEKTRKELLTLSDEELFLQLLAADKEDLCRQTGLHGTVRATVLQLAGMGHIFPRTGIDCLKVNGQTVYLSGRYLAAYGADHNLVWWGLAQPNRHPQEKKTPSDLAFTYTPTTQIVPELYQILNAPGHANINPFIKTSSDLLKLSDSLKPASSRSSPNLDLPAPK